MKCFSAYLREYRKGGLVKCAEYQFALPVEEPVIPESVKTNLDAAKFFAGTNVYNERIETWNKKYSYEALYCASRECREEELIHFIATGLQELGCMDTEVSVKKVEKGLAKRENQEFRITIKTL